MRLFEEIFYRAVRVRGKKGKEEKKEKREKFFRAIERSEDSTTFFPGFSVKKLKEKSKSSLRASFFETASLVQAT